MSIFDNYDNLPEDYVPNNRHKHLCLPKQEVITIGATCDHIFDIDLDLTDIPVLAIYKQGVEMKLTKEPSNITIDSEKGCSTLTFTLTPEETEEFNNYILDTNVQLKFFIPVSDTSGGFKEYSFEYSPVYKLKVLPTLDY